jgi:hypothetical protein
MKRKNSYPRQMSAIDAAESAIARNSHFNICYLNSTDEQRAARALARAAVRAVFSRTIYRRREPLLRGK